jgi:hypothetical protein
MIPSVKALDENCLQYVGKLLFFHAHSGWGWLEIMPTTDNENFIPVNPPLDFHLRIKDFYMWQGVLRGAIARVEEAGHQFDGYWAISCTRTYGTFNFTDNINSLNIGICPGEPKLLDPSIDPEIAPYWPLWSLSGKLQLRGYGMAAVSFEYIEDWEEEHTISQT